MSRVLTALLLLPPLLALIWLGPRWSFLILAELVALLSAREIFSMIGAKGYRPFRWTGYLGTAVLVAAFVPAMPAGEWLLLLVVLAVGFAAIRRGAPQPATLVEISTTIMVSLYAGALMSALVGLRFVDPDPLGRSWIFFLLAVVMIGDTGAYYAGRSFGRRPLAPRISPKKTWEGLVGGLLASLLAALAFAALLELDLRPARALGVGLAVSLAGVAGDLFESLLKRSMEAKDASSLIPGHGGMLDRVDSLLFGAPVLLLYVRVFH